MILCICEFSLKPAIIQFDTCDPESKSGCSDPVNTKLHLIIHVQQIVFCGNSFFIRGLTNKRKLSDFCQMNLNVLTNVVVTEFPKILLGSGHRRCWGAGGVDHVTKLTQSCISFFRFSAKILQSPQLFFSNDNPQRVRLLFCYFYSITGWLWLWSVFASWAPLLLSALFLSRSQASVLWRRNNQSSQLRPGAGYCTKWCCTGH